MDTSLPVGQVRPGTRAVRACPLTGAAMLKDHSEAVAGCQVLLLRPKPLPHQSYRLHEASRWEAAAGIPGLRSLEIEPGPCPNAPL